MRSPRHSAVIYKKKDGTYAIDIHLGDPKPPEDVEVIDIMQRKDSESFCDFRERCVRFVKEECK